MPKSNSSHDEEDAVDPFQYREEGETREVLMQYDDDSDEEVCIFYKS